MAKLKGMVTAVAVARQASDSYKTTIPTQVAGPMELAHKDRVRWTLDKVGGEWVATLRKVEPEPAPAH